MLILELSRLIYTKIHILSNTTVWKYQGNQKP
jgi:hypothetical protein